MERITYSKMVSRLEGFDPWLVSLGLKPVPNDRIHEAFKLLRKADEASRIGHETGKYTNIAPDDWFGIVEALEAHDVFAAFHNDAPLAVAPVMKRALSGPARPADENARNRDGRNIWFELALAAEWRLRGAAVSLGEPDLRLTKDDVTFLLACKRPDSIRSVKTSLRFALKQIEDNLEGAPDNCFGVVAISLNRVFNDGNQVFSGKMEVLGDLLAGVLDEYKPYLNKAARNPKFCCVVFHIATPGLGEGGVDMVRASYAVAQELWPSIGSKIFKQHTVEMYSPKQGWSNSVNQSSSEI